MAVALFGLRSTPSIESEAVPHTLTTRAAESAGEIVYLGERNAWHNMLIRQRRLVMRKRCR